MEPIKQADRYLAEIAASKKKVEEIQSLWEAAIKELEKQYGQRLQAEKQKIRELEKNLIKLVKTNVRVIFEKSDKRELKHGVLFFEVINKVKRARSVTVEKLKELGYLDGIKVIEKVNWEVLEKWPDEKLIAVGTERVKKEEVKYEVSLR